jgi:hypothetical protein
MSWQAVTVEEVGASIGLGLGARLLNASVGAKGAKENSQERKDGESLLSSLRPWSFFFAPFAPTLAFSDPAKAQSQNRPPP